jgi:hypothetical protein
MTTTKSVSRMFIIRASVSIDWSSKMATMVCSSGRSPPPAVYLEGKGICVRERAKGESGKKRAESRARWGERGEREDHRFAAATAALPCQERADSRRKRSEQEEEIGVRCCSFTAEVGRERSEQEKEGAAAIRLPWARSKKVCCCCCSSTAELSGEDSSNPSLRPVTSHTRSAAHALGRTCARRPIRALGARVLT